MPRDVNTTLASKQALSIPSAADLAATNGTNDITPQSHGPYKLVYRVKNADAADSMTTGTFLAFLRFSTDSGSSFRTNDEAKVSIPASELAVGGDAVRHLTIDRDWFNAEGIAPAAVRLRVVWSTTGHTTASIVDIEATAYLDIGDVGAYN